ncbi:MAG: hypothetical protein R6W75_01770, partial [Smithellaceae bacterium]
SELEYTCAVDISKATQKNPLFLADTQAYIGGNPTSGGIKMKVWWLKNIKLQRKQNEKANKALQPIAARWAAPR